MKRRRRERREAQAARQRPATTSTPAAGAAPAENAPAGNVVPGTGTLAASATIVRPVGRQCSVCAHPEREAIDEAILSDVPFRTIAHPRGLSHVSVIRHASAHIPALLAEARDAELVAHADSLLAVVEDLRAKANRLYDEAMAQLAEAKSEGMRGAALMAIKVATGALARATEVATLLGRVTGELREQGAQTQILLVDARGKPSPEWLEIRQRLVDALRPWPEAARAAAEALRELRSGAEAA